MSSKAVNRRLVHTREIKTQAFARDDGLWDLEASLIDTKAKDFPLASGVRPAGDAIHHMFLLVTIDERFNIVAAQARTESMPYPGYCNRIEPEYQKLVGLNLLNGFRSDVKRLLSGVLGCSHLTELCSVLPTVAIQAFAGEVINVRDGQKESSLNMPFQLNRCHALRTDQEVVKKYYQTWYGAPVVPSEMPKIKK